MKLVKLVLYLLIVIYISACDEKVQQRIVEDVAITKVATPTENIDYIVVSRTDYSEKLHGFWLGQSIANWTGLITEMDKVGTPATMPFYTDEDWGTTQSP